ncbi:hypothetical protein D0Z07_6183 [Hyphodiscus hymeniophilus]|uniref:Uncharacterized protein n=1 Tax=Hyphodiscus hymeniophilus TaxID=353542 RepID=A0A9P6VF17_9HELO|nr:hypothetical protein D0Z07_6183 [Hyphodiscus hymeniophilus]
MNPVPNIDSAPLNRPPRVNNTSPSFQGGPAWQLPLRLLPPTCPVDSLLIGIVQRQRALLAVGAPKAEILGPYHPSMIIIAYPDQNEDGHALSTLIANLFLRTPIPGTPEKAACLYVTYHLTQWQIDPSPETYANLPEWHRARPSQVMTPHPTWVTQMVFGKLRDRVIANQERYATEEFHALYLVSLNINWPRGPMDIFVIDGNDMSLLDTARR